LWRRKGPSKSEFLKLARYNVWVSCAEDGQDPQTLIGIHSASKIPHEAMKRGMLYEEHGHYLRDLLPWTINEYNHTTRGLPLCS
jgi:hypothetical protein